MDDVIQRCLQHMPDDAQCVSNIYGEQKCDARGTHFHRWIRLSGKLESDVDRVELFRLTLRFFDDVSTAS